MVPPRAEPRSAARDRGLTLVVSLVLLALAAAVAAVGVHLWVDSFTGPEATSPEPIPPDVTVVFRDCDLEEDVVTVAHHHGPPLALRNLDVTLESASGDGDGMAGSDVEAQLGPLTQGQETWGEGQLLHLGGEAGERSIPWGNASRVASEGLNATKLYHLTFTDRVSGGPIDTVGFRCG